MMYAMRAQKRYCGLVIACCLAQLASLIINPFYSRIFGPRYLYKTSTGLIALTAIFLVRAPALWRSRLHLRWRLNVAHGAMASVVVMFFIMSFRSVPAVALVSEASKEESRGAFMSIQGTLINLSAAMAAIIAGKIVMTSPEGLLLNYAECGWLSSAIVILSIPVAVWSQRKIRPIKPESVTK
jgi:hypothetical protein